MRAQLILFSIIGVFAFVSPLSTAQACGGNKAAGGGCGCGSQGGGAGAGGCGAKAAKAANGCGGGGAGCGCGGKQQAAVNRDAFKMPSGVKWQELADARRMSITSGKPMLVFFSFGSQSPYDQQMNKRMFKSGALTTDLNARQSAIPVFGPLWAMTPTERALAESLKYNESTLLALVDANGKVRKTSSGQELRTAGIPEPDALLATIRPLVN